MKTSKIKQNQQYRTTHNSETQPEQKECISIFFWFRDNERKRPVFLNRWEGLRARHVFKMVGTKIIKARSSCIMHSRSLKCLGLKFKGRRFATNIVQGQTHAPKMGGKPWSRPGTTEWGLREPKKNNTCWSKTKLMELYIGLISKRKRVEIPPREGYGILFRSTMPASCQQRGKICTCKLKVARMHKMHEKLLGHEHAIMWRLASKACRNNWVPSDGTKQHKKNIQLS